MKKIIIKITSIFVCMAFIISFSGCIRNIDVSRLVEEPIPFKAPEVTDSEMKISPPEAENQYQGAYIDISPVFGDSVRITGLDYAIQLIFEAYNNPNLLVNEEPSKRGYKNSIKIYNRKDQLLGSFEISSDFLQYARADKNSPLFLMPEYSYYMIEYALWKAGASLVPPMEDWERIEPVGDERAEYNVGMLELRLEHDVKTILVQKYGYSEAYFLNYDIYSTAEYSSNKELSVRVYVLVGYAGYSKYEEVFTVEEIEQGLNVDPKTLFSPDSYRSEKAARLVYTFVDSRYFRMTSYTENAEYDKEFPSTLESRVRAIFPYEDMKKVMETLNDVSEIRLDLHRQALDYLRISGQGDIEIDD